MREEALLFIVPWVRPVFLRSIFIADYSNHESDDQTVIAGKCSPTFAHLVFVWQLVIALMSHEDQSH